MLKPEIRPNLKTENSLNPTDPENRLINPIENRIQCSIKSHRIQHRR